MEHEAAAAEERGCCWRHKEEEGHSSSASSPERYALSFTPLIRAACTDTDICICTDLSELSLGSTMKTHFPNPDDILNFTLTLTPDEGLYKGGVFNFSFAISQNFPHEPPKVKCKEKIYHPNIDLEGNVCLNILREDWKPVLNLNAVIVGLQFLFLEPNASDPLNKEAANDLMSDRDRFKRNVRSAMAGGSVKGEAFDRVMK